MTNLQNPIIILIGGAAGTGKTSVAKSLCAEMGIAHRLGSGFVREIAKSFISLEQNPFLYNYSFRPHIDITPFENLYKQSEVIKDPMDGCIKRAFHEGTSLVIEGVNIIPGLMFTKNVSLSVVLTVEDYDRHFNMITGKTHFKRGISEKDFQKIRLVQDDFKKIARANGWPIIDVGTTDYVVGTIKRLLKEKVEL